MARYGMLAGSEETARSLLLRDKRIRMRVDVHLMILGLVAQGTHIVVTKIPIFMSANRIPAPWAVKMR